VLRIDLLSARRGHYEERESWLDPHQVMEELKGFLIAPLQIIGDE
jgi:hypothetical protein